MKWVTVALSLSMPSADPAQGPIAGHPDTYSPDHFAPHTRAVYVLLARCLHVFLGLLDSPAAASRLLASGAAELCVAVLNHPWYEVSWTSLLVLQRLTSGRSAGGLGGLFVLVVIVGICLGLFWSVLLVGFSVLICSVLFLLIVSVDCGDA